MKKVVLFALLLCSVCNGFGQAYIAMPTDSAVWRYRISDIDYITRIFDNIIFLDGTDTLAHGNIYRRLSSRTFAQQVPNGTVPPVVTDTASTPDNKNYGGIRESGKQVFLLSLNGEDLIYNFNALVGDSIPAYGGTVKVTAIDSVFLGGVYHKRYLTTDPAYYVIEGVGSSEGLIPALNDGSGAVDFMCFTGTSYTFSPDTTVPCTYIYPIWVGLTVSNVNVLNAEINVFPVPATDALYVSVNGKEEEHAVVFNGIGQVVWSGVVHATEEIAVGLWPRGVYYMRFSGDAGLKGQKIILE